MISTCRKPRCSIARPECEPSGWRSPLVSDHVRRVGIAPQRVGIASCSTTTDRGSPDGARATSRPARSTLAVYSMHPFSVRTAGAVSWKTENLNPSTGHAQTIASDHYVCANYSDPSSDLVYALRRFAALIEHHGNGYRHTVRALVRRAKTCPVAGLTAVSVKIATPPTDQPPAWYFRRPCRQPARQRMAPTRFRIGACVHEPMRYR